MTTHPTAPSTATDPRLTLVSRLNSPPYDAASGRYCTPLDEAAQMVDAHRAAVYAEVAERLAADAEQGDKEGFTRIYRRSAAKQVREWGDLLRSPAAKPETEAPAADRDALRRKFGDVLRHWGLLDEQIDQKAAEDAAVDGLLALLPEPAARPETHACSNCEGIDPDTCLANPDRPPEQCPRSEGDGYGLQCQKPAGHNLCTFEEETTDA